MTKNAVVWTEIPVTDMEKSVAFYNEVFEFGATIDNSGPNPMAMFGGTENAVGGHLYPGKPAPDGGNTVHLNVPDGLEAAMKRCETAGGQIVSPIVTIPPGRFAYAKDLDGNSLGLFEATS
ncbi:VOC family protein [Loktanella sp. S4079]|uniref:VOC family protein n=1 Tax=Loktanella sp. S4079 TaxID=579483 RepID=UPI0005FA1E06|nr:VOC family protein [Loktanella sp. S4079]KJZ19572.1 glyoxalase [Loktanella sp. S4079]